MIILKTNHVETIDSPGHNTDHRDIDPGVEGSRACPPVCSKASQAIKVVKLVKLFHIRNTECAGNAKISFIVC